MTRLSDAIPSVEALLNMEPEELGGVILSQFDDYSRTNGKFHRQAVVYFDSARSFVDRPQNTEEVEQAITEAVHWLDVAGICIPAPGIDGSNGWRVLSRRGRRLKQDGTISNYKAAALLPQAMLHPKLVSEVWPLFIKGSHDLAVFAAFRHVEVAVREAARLPNDSYGKKLMQDAWKKDGGILTDPDAVDSEQEALMFLFLGAIGFFKNPQSHRIVGVNESKGAAEMVLLASHLLRIVDERAAKLSANRSNN